MTDPGAGRHPARIGAPMSPVPWTWSPPHSTMPAASNTPSELIAEPAWFCSTGVSGSPWIACAYLVGTAAVSVIATALIRKQDLHL